MVFSLLAFVDGWVDGLGRCPGLIVGMRVSLIVPRRLRTVLTIGRIVEYATREQAQQAVAQLSNQNLMGRLVYVREVSVDSLDARMIGS